MGCNKLLSQLKYGCFPMRTASLIYIYNIFLTTSPTTLCNLKVTLT